MDWCYRWLGQIASAWALAQGDDTILVPGVFCTGVTLLLEGSSSSGDAQAVEGVADKADAASCGRHRGLCMTREVIICRHPPFINSESGIDDAR